MSAEGSLSSAGASLDDLIALTEEMAALVRAGVPLEEGLVHVARDLARRPGRIAEKLAQRMQAGETLLHVITTSPEIFPPSYRAVVEAGLRCGRLPAALEGLASTSRRASELGKLSRVAILYPVFIALLAYGLFVASLIWFQPMMMRTYAALRVPPDDLNLRLISLGQIPIQWFAVIPIAGLLVLAAWWYRSSRAVVRNSAWQRMTPVGRMIYYGRMATFADMLALMVENGTELKRAVLLAADASGDTQLQSSAQDVAADIERGVVRPLAHGQGSGPADVSAEASNVRGTSTGANRPRRRFPPLVNWLLSGGGSQTTLAESLRSTAATYHRSALRLDNWLRSYLPLSLTVVIGGTTVALYAVGMLGPWFEVLKAIASQG